MEKLFWIEKETPKTSKMSRIKTITLNEIRVKCDKCNKEISYNETCECQKEDVPPQPEYDSIIYDIPEYLKLASKFKEFVENKDLIYKSKMVVTLFKDRMEIKGTRTKFGKIIDDHFTIELNEEGIPQLKDLLDHVDEWKDLISEGCKKFNISPAKFLFSSRYRSLYFDFDCHRWTVANYRNWKLLGGFIFMYLFGIGSDIIQYEIREYLRE